MEDKTDKKDVIELMEIENLKMLCESGVMNDLYLLNILRGFEELQRRRDYRHPKERGVELTKEEYAFLQRYGLIESREVTKQADEKDHQSWRQYVQAEGRVNQLLNKRSEVEHKRFVVRRGKKIRELEQLIQSATQEMDATKREWEALRTTPTFDSTFHSKEKEIVVAGNENIVYTQFTERGKNELRDLSWIYSSPDMGNISSIIYASPEHLDIVRSFREWEEKDFTDFFRELLVKLNSLTDDAARLISQTAFFRVIQLEGHPPDEDFSTPRPIKYVRKFEIKNEPFYSKTKVMEGYTGFIFENKMVSPNDLGGLIKEHKRSSELHPEYVEIHPLYEPTFEGFFSEWRGKGDTYLVEEIERKFPEAKKIRLKEKII